MLSRTRALGRYILPAVGGLSVIYLYNVVDGIFVGQGVGPEGLGAVNIAVPFITFADAIAAMPPMGGATIAAIRFGQGDKEGAQHAFMTALSVTAVLSVLLMVLGMAFAQQIADISGARTLSDTMRTMATQYLFYHSAFCIPWLLSSCLSVFVRNDGAPVLAFVGMCVGAAMNIFLDWLFIFPLGWGTIGAAIASGLGQIASFLLLLTHFVRKRGSLRIRRFKADIGLTKEVCRRGLPEAVSQATTPITALCYNIMLARMIGDIGVSTFSVLSYIYSLVNAILSGVAQGLQPLWGQAYGRRGLGEIHWLFRWGMIIAAGLSVAISAVMIFFSAQIVHIFSRDGALIQSASTALPYFALSFIPMGCDLVFTAYMYSTKRTAQANVVAVSRGIVLKAVTICCMPLLFGITSIWLAPFVTEIITLTLAVILNSTRRGKLRLRA